MEDAIEMQRRVFLLGDTLARVDVSFSLGKERLGMYILKYAARTYTLRVDLLAAVVEDVAVALAADGALVERHDVLWGEGENHL